MKNNNRYPVIVIFVLLLITNSYGTETKKNYKKTDLRNIKASIKFSEHYDFRKDKFIKLGGNEKIELIKTKYIDGTTGFIDEMNGKEITVLFGKIYINNIFNNDMAIILLEHKGRNLEMIARFNLLYNKEIIDDLTVMYSETQKAILFGYGNSEASDEIIWIKNKYELRDAPKDYE